MKIVFIFFVISYILVHFLELYFNRRNQKVSDINIPIDVLAEDVIRWCRTMYPVRKKSPRVIISNEKSKLAGEYCHFNNTITIYRKNNVLHSCLIDTLIHEYFHYYLITSNDKNFLYQKQLEIYGYENHPQEIICRVAAAELKKKYLKSNY